MKKIISLILAISLLLGVCSLTACNKSSGDGTSSTASAADSIVSIAPQNASGAAGARITVPLEIKNAAAIKQYGNGTLVAVQFKVKVDTNQLTLISAKSTFEDAEDGSNWMCDSSLGSDGTYMVMIMDNNLIGVSPDGDITLANLYFEAASTASGEYPVELELVDICDSDANSEIEGHVSVSNASITVG